MYPTEPTDVDRAAFRIARMAQVVRDDVACRTVECLFGLTNRDWFDYKGYRRAMGAEFAPLFNEHEIRACAEYDLPLFRWYGATKTAIRNGRNLWLWADACLDPAMAAPPTTIDESTMRGDIDLVYPKRFVRTRSTNNTLHAVYNAFLRNHDRAPDVRAAPAASTDDKITGESGSDRVDHVATTPANSNRPTTKPRQSERRAAMARFRRDRE